MWHRYIKQVVWLLLFAGITQSCANRNLGGEEKPDRLPKVKEKQLITALDSISGLRPETFYTKIKCTFSDTNRTVNFKASIRMVKDSVINTLITYAAIPVVGALVRPDSIIVSNKRENCFVRTDLTYIRESFGVDFNYKNIEELLLGLPIGFDTSQRYFQINDPFHYVLSSKRKREIKKELKGTRTERERDRLLNRRDNQEEEEDVILQYYISKDLRSIDRIDITSPEDTAKISIEYLSRDSVETHLTPNEVHIEIVTPRNHIVLDMDYDKTEVNKPQEIVFVIPEEYVECGTKE
jgi:hypothetical protein